MIPQSQCKHGHITATISSHLPCASSQTNSAVIYSKLHSIHSIYCHWNPDKYEADIPSLTPPNQHFTVCTYLPIVLLYPPTRVVIAANCAVTPSMDACMRVCVRVRMWVFVCGCVRFCVSACRCLCLCPFDLQNPADWPGLFCVTMLFAYIIHTMLSISCELLTWPE